MLNLWVFFGLFAIGWRVDTGRFYGQLVGFTILA